MEELEQKCEKYIMQEEIGEGGTPHLQMKICFAKRMRPVGTFTSKKIHWESSKMWKGWEYCAKDDTHVGRRWSKGLPKPKQFDEPYGWQLKVIEIVKQEPDERSIYWFWEPKGGVGKSDLCRYLCVKFNAIAASRASDIKCTIARLQEKGKHVPNIMIMDIPRYFKHVSYVDMDGLKDGLFYSSRYGRTVIMNHPHMIVFSNREPDYEMMSKDRWKVFDIRELMKQECPEAPSTEQCSPR